MSTSPAQRGWIITGGTLAAIVVAVPVCLGWVSQAFEINRCPARMTALEARAAENERRMAVLETGQQDIKDCLRRIEGFLRVPARSESPRLQEQTK